MFEQIGRSHINLQTASNINHISIPPIRFTDPIMQASVHSRKFIIDNTQLTGKQLRTAPSPQETLKDGAHCFYNIVNPSNKIQCDDCKRDISKTTKILAQDSDLCVSCFSNIDEFPEDYHVINKLDYPLFDQEWTADQELMLFEGLEKLSFHYLRHGFGNWGQIAEFIGANKTREDVEEHYVSYFLDSQDFMPTAAVITQRDSSGKLIRSGAEGTHKKFQKTVSRIYSSHSVQSFQRGSLTVNQMTVGMQAGSNPAEIVGYMPKRGDFEVQFDNDAELLLAEMEFNDDDSQEQVQMKFRLIEIYNHKLTQRNRRKEFVISRKLLDLKEQLRLQKTRTKQEKQIYNMMKVFARFSSPEQHEQLVQGIIKEKQIRVRLEQLNELKKKGFRTMAELNDQLQNKKKKDQKAKKIEDPIFLGSQRPKSSAQDSRSKKSKKDLIVQKMDKKPLFPNQQQNEICRKFNISLKQFLIIKQTLIRESLKLGIIDLDEASKIFKIGRPAIERVLDYLVEKDQLLGNLKQNDDSFDSYQ